MNTLTITKKVGIGDGMFITYKGTPNICTHWEVLEVVGTSEQAGLGTLSKQKIVTDKNGFAVNQYFAPTNAGDAGKTERIKVHEGA